MSSSSSSLTKSGVSAFVKNQIKLISSTAATKIVVPKSIDPVVKLYQLDPIAFPFCNDTGKNFNLTLLSDDTVPSKSDEIAAVSALLSLHAFHLSFSPEYKGVSKVVDTLTKQEILCNYNELRSYFSGSLFLRAYQRKVASKFDPTVKLARETAIKQALADRQTQTAAVAAQVTKEARIQADIEAAEARINAGVENKRKVLSSINYDDDSSASDSDDVVPVMKRQKQLIPTPAVSKSVSSAALSSQSMVKLSHLSSSSSSSSNDDDDDDDSNGTDGSVSDSSSSSSSSDSDSDSESSDDNKQVDKDLEYDNTISNRAARRLDIGDYGTDEEEGEIQVDVSQFGEFNHRRYKTRDNLPKPNLRAFDSKGNPIKMKRFIIFIGNLDYDVTAADVMRLFHKCSVVDIRLLSAKDSGRARGCGFVEFSNPQDIHHSLLYDGSMLLGRKLRVQLSAGGGGKSRVRKNRIKTKNDNLNREKNARLQRENW